MEGYNFRFNIGSKNFVGVTSDNLSIAAVTKDSITKDDQGARKKKVTGHDTTFRVSGIMGLNGTSGTDNDSDDIIEQAFHEAPKDNAVFLPKVMSRKKQIIPMLSALWG